MDIYIYIYIYIAALRYAEAALRALISIAFNSTKVQIVLISIAFTSTKVQILTRFADLRYASRSMRHIYSRMS